jgi:hypothetical protein
LEKRRHHYIWQYYLPAWAENDLVYCLFERKKISQPNTINLGVKRDFYRLQRLTAKDRQNVKRLIERSPVEFHETYWNFVTMFDGWFEEKDLLSQMTGDTSECVRKINEKISNAEEDYHGIVENNTIPILEKLRAGDISVLSDDDTIADFCYFLTVQLTRTMSLRQHMLKWCAINPKIYDPTNAWAIISHIYATTIGAKLFNMREMNPIRLISNKTNLPFITGDQPVVNLQGQLGGVQPEYLSFYYPISPTMAVFIDDAQHPFGLESVISSSSRIEQLNAVIVEVAHFQIYAQTKPCLLPYCPD